MRINWKKFNREVHFWGASLCAVPLMIVIITGLLLIVRKDFHWIQPATMNGTGNIPKITFERIIDTAKTVKEADIQNWSDVDRLDVRPNKGIIKIRSKNRWEIQIDHQTSEILQTSYRRSGLIESLHDGTFWGRSVSYFIFLPSAIILLILLVTGIYLFITTYISKSNIKKNKKMLNINNNEKT